MTQWPGSQDRKSQSFFFNEATPWVTDPGRKRKEFIEKYATGELQGNIAVMRLATQEEASARAFMRGDSILFFGPDVVCEVCTQALFQYVPHNINPELVKSSSETIWMGDDKGWVCLICCTVSPINGTIPPPSEAKNYVN